MNHTEKACLGAIAPEALKIFGVGRVCLHDGLMADDTEPIIPSIGDARGRVGVQIMDGVGVIGWIRGRRKLVPRKASL